jgi:hypothetical protein
MPKNEVGQDAQSSVPETAKPETAWKKFERERDARRQGLRKVGITSNFWSAMTSKKVTPAAASDQHQPEAVTEQEPVWERVERERLARRAALRKIGMTTGMAVFAMFSVDDLARMVGQKMEQRAGDSKVADQIAKEFSEAGIALANGPSCGCQPGCGCGGCIGTAELCQCGCLTAYNDCAGSPPPGCANGANPFNPTCIAYNFNISYNCDPQRTKCQQNCPS